MVLAFWAMTTIMTVAMVARADVLIGVNGERFVGRVIEETPDRVIFESEIGGRLTVPRARVRDLQRTAPTESKAAQSPVPSSAGSPALTNALWQPPSVGHDGYDWIQLKSGEWLKGELKYVQEKKVEFDSDELEDLTLEIKDVRRLYTARPMFIKFDGREPVFGTIVMTNDVVVVTGPEQVSLPRSDITGITPGGKREIDFWSGKISLGLNLQSGNTRQVTLSTSADLARRTPATKLELDYLGNYSEVSGTENVNNHRVNATYDIRLNRSLFVRPVQAEYYRDPLANISQRLTVGVGVGYDIFDRDGLEWQVAAGPGYQYTRFLTVEAGQADSTSTPAAMLQSYFKADITKRFKIILSYGGTFMSSEAGLYSHHAVSTFEYEIKRHLNLDTSFVWDYLQSPQTESSGAVPLRSDYRLILGVGVRF